MDNFIKNIKKKLSVDNLVDMMKDSKVIDENAVKEEDVRKTLQKIDPNTLMDVEEITEKLNEISDGMNKSKPETSKKVIDTAKSSTVTMSNEKTERQNTENEYRAALGREENVFKLYDDF